MFDQILSNVKELATSYASPFTTIEHGALPPENGLALYPGPGIPPERHFDRGAVYEESFVLNGKHSDLETLLTALSSIHCGLSTIEDYPKTDDWQILNIETATPPNYLDREVSGTKQWLYGSILAVKFYIKGVQRNV